MARACVCLFVRLSVRLSVHKSCKHDTDWTVPARTFKLCTLTSYDKRTNPIDFQGQGSKVKVTRNTLLLNLVDTIQTEPFKIGPSNLVHILLMTRGRHLLISKVRGQRSRSHAKHCCLTKCKHDTHWTLQARTIKLGTHTSYDKRRTTINFQGQGSKVKVTYSTLLLSLVNKVKPFYIANYDVISLLNPPVGRILQRWRCSCQFYHLSFNIKNSFSHKRECH